MLSSRGVRKACVRRRPYSRNRTIVIYRVRDVRTMSNRAEARSHIDDLSRLCGRMTFSPMPQAFWTPVPRAPSSARTEPVKESAQVV